MRQIRSYGSVTAIWLDRDELVRRLHEVASEALARFPEIQEIRLIGSVARGDHTGLSDVDIAVLLEREPGDILKALWPYFEFFSKRLEMAVDVVLGVVGEEWEASPVAEGSVVLASRRTDQAAL